MKDFELIYASQLRQKQRESRALVIDIRDRKEYGGNTGREPSAIRMISWNEELPVCRKTAS